MNETKHPFIEGAKVVIERAGGYGSPCHYDHRTVAKVRKDGRFLLNLGTTQWKASEQIVFGEKRLVWRAHACGDRRYREGTIRLLSDAKSDVEKAHKEQEKINLLRKIQMRIERMRTNECHISDLQTISIILDGCKSPEDQ